MKNVVKKTNNYFLNYQIYFMKYKKVGWYLIFVGLLIFVIEFITAILSFILHHPILGLAFILVGFGMFFITLDK